MTRQPGDRITTAVGAIREPRVYRLLRIIPQQPLIAPRHTDHQDDVPAFTHVMGPFLPRRCNAGLDSIRWAASGRLGLEMAPALAIM